MGNKSATRRRRVIEKNEEQADSSEYESDGEWDNLPEFPKLSYPNRGYVRSIKEGKRVSNLLLCFASRLAVKRTVKR